MLRNAKENDLLKAEKKLWDIKKASWLNWQLALILSILYGVIRTREIKEVILNLWA